MEIFEKIRSMNKKEKREAVGKAISEINNLKAGDDIMLGLAASLDKNKIKIDELEKFGQVKNINLIKEKLNEMEVEEKLDFSARAYHKIINLPSKSRVAILVAVFLLASYFDVNAQEIMEITDGNLGQADPWWA